MINIILRVCSPFFPFSIFIEGYYIIFVAYPHFTDKETGFELEVIYCKMVFKNPEFYDLTNDSQFWLHIKITWRTFLN